MNERTNGTAKKTYCPRRQCRMAKSQKPITKALEIDNIMQRNIFKICVTRPAVQYGFIAGY